MKHLLRTVACATMVLTLFNCTVDPVEYNDAELLLTEENITAEVNDPCDGDNPEARITNNGTVPIDLDILNENNEVVGFVHNLLPGNTSIWLTFPPGDLLFSVSNDFVQDEKVVYSMSTCMIFDMEVDIDNLLTEAEPESI